MPITNKELERRKLVEAGIMKESDFLQDNFALSVDNLNVSSQGNKIVLTMRQGNVYNKLFEIDVEKALAIGIAIRSVATCVKYSKR
jgi:hypothetical protein